MSAPRGESPTSTASRLVDAAAKLFYRAGYEGTSTRELSQHLGINKASLYHHIESKEHLLFAVCQRALDSLFEDVKGALTNVEPDVELEVAIKAHLTSTLSHIEAHAVMLREMRSLTGERLETVSDRRVEYEGLLASLITAGQESGRLREDIPSRQLTLALLDLINWPVVWFQPGGSLTPQEIAEFSADIFLNGGRRQL